MIQVHRDLVWFSTHLTGPQDSFTQSSFPTSLQHVLVHGLFLCRCRNLFFCLLYFMRFLSAHFFSLLRSLWTSAPFCGLSVASLTFFYHVQICWACILSHYPNNYEDINSICPSIDPLGALLTCLGPLLPSCVVSPGDTGVIQVSHEYHGLKTWNYMKVLSAFSWSGVLY